MRLWQAFKRVFEVCVSDEFYIRCLYLWKLKRWPDLSNPRRFTEKLQWLKLHDRNPKLTLCADKVEARHYARSVYPEIRIIDILQSSGNPSDYPSQNLPFRHIIKASHASGCSIIVDRERMLIGNKALPYNLGQIRRELARWMALDFFPGTREWEYKDIPHRFVVEPLLGDSANDFLLNDYKVHCFQGEPLYIQTIFDRTKGVKEDWYDTGWNPQDVHYFSPVGKKQSCPPEFLELLKAARALSSEFAYVRVDLYIVDGTVYFGEYTFRPYRGVMKFVPPEWDFKLGELLNVPT